MNGQPNDGAKLEWENVFDQEIEELTPRGSGSEGIRNRLLGLALSGGGIRSASFALGVFQALIAFRVVNRFHYLSTVSGGSYLGAAIAWLRKEYERRDRYWTAEHGDAPKPQGDWTEQFTSKLGVRRKDALKKSEGPQPNAALRSSAEIADSDDEVVGPKNRFVWLDYIRQHCNYLRPPGMGLASLVGVVLRNGVLGFGVYLALGALCLRLVRQLGMLDTPQCHAHSLFAQIGDVAFRANPAICYDLESVGLAICMLMVATFIAYSLGSFVSGFKGVNERAAAILVSSFGVLPIVIGLRTSLNEQLSHGTNERLTDPWSFSLLASGFLLLGLFVYYLRNRPRTRNRQSTIESEEGLYWLRIKLQRLIGLALVVLVVLAAMVQAPRILSGLGKLHHDTLYALIVIAAISAIAVSIIYAMRFKSIPAALHVAVAITFTAVVLACLVGIFRISEWMLSLTPVGMLLAAVVIISVAFATNLNQFGIGRMYRDRLMEAFMPDLKSISECRWMPALDANTDGTLAKMWCRDPVCPSLYPIINCHLVLIDSPVDRYRARGGDSFSLTPRACGSDATGWIRTASFGDGQFKAGTAMAISGAAANPDAASGGHGFTRNRLVAFLMFLAQARLGAWVVNPNNDARRGLGRWMSLLLGQRPNFIWPGIPSGLLGAGQREDAYFLELTDGGHFDNTGAYELIRRRAKLIVLAQASQDQEFGFGDLANLAEKVRVDFGARLFFRHGLPLEGLVPTAGETGRARLSRRGHAIARIKYRDPEEHGWLVYLQATPLEALSVDVHSYQQRHGEFPNEPTANQFFREAQFEAYRELGYAVAKRFLVDVLRSHEKGALCNCAVDDSQHAEAANAYNDIFDLLRPPPFSTSSAQPVQH